MDDNIGNLLPLLPGSKKILKAAIELGNENLAEYSIEESYLVINWSTVCRRANVDPYEIACVVVELLNLGLICWVEEGPPHFNLLIRNFCVFCKRKIESDTEVAMNALTGIEEILPKVGTIY